MGPIQVEEEGLGSFEWDLPEGLSGRLEQLDEDSQKVVRELVELHLRMYLHILLGALSMGEKASETLLALNKATLSVGEKYLKQASFH